MRITKEEYEQLKTSETLYQLMSKWIAESPSRSMEYLEWAWRELYESYSQRTRGD